MLIKLTSHKDKFSPEDYQKLKHKFAADKKAFSYGSQDANLVCNASWHSEHPQIPNWAEKDKKHSP